MKFCYKNRMNVMLAVMRFNIKRTKDSSLLCMRKWRMVLMLAEMGVDAKSSKDISLPKEAEDDCNDGSKEC